MLLEEALSKLQELEKQGYGKLIIAISIKDKDVEVKDFNVQLSFDGVGQFVEAEYVI